MCERNSCGKYIGIHKSPYMIEKINMHAMTFVGLRICVMKPILIAVHVGNSVIFTSIL